MKMIKKIVLMIVALATFTWGGMIEWQDDDRIQWLTFEDCNPDSIAQVVFWFSKNLDSGYVNVMCSLSDTIDFTGWNLMNPDRDENGRAIPGHYHGEYWWYLDCITWEGDTLPVTDINHVAVDYTIPTPCGGIFHVD